MPDEVPRGWSATDIPDSTGRTFVITGGNSGLGYETALALVRKGARVILACRNLGKAEVAVDSLRAERNDAEVEAMELDLASLESVQRFTDAFRKRHDSLDVLVNNAGVMALPLRRTAEGFEMQIGTNHLGHFALTGRLLDLLLSNDGRRVVNVSSTAHKAGWIRFDDLQWEQGYRKWLAYGQSKIANLYFTYELQRRLEAAGSPCIAVAAHPGYAATNLQHAGPRMDGSLLMERVMSVANRLASQSAAMGALPQLYAATAPGVEGADYFGPGGFMETKGHPARVSSVARAHDADTAARLWEVSEELTGVRYAFER
jgi:NAD(P)-dependent dehydrogenase (short-subunit alcohol dehydrogenase family)